MIKKLKLSLVECKFNFILLVGLSTVSFLEAQEEAQYGFSWTQEDIFISKSEGSDLVNIHMYGWGSLWPFPDGQEGEFDDGSILDSRINRAVADGQDVMITIATAPSIYRASGEPWNLEEKVSPEHEDAYVERVKEFLINREAIKYVQVWNEFKGFWNSELNRWDYEAYTTFYNKVYEAVKEVREDVLVGGGYVAIRERGFGFDAMYNDVLVDHRDIDAMIYWMENATGFDAVCIDGDFAPGSYSKLTTYLKSLDESKDKPIWWSEFYNASGTMQEVATDISSNLEPGDKSLWWAEERFLPFLNPTRTTSISDFQKINNRLSFTPNPATSSIVIQGDITSEIEYVLMAFNGDLIMKGAISNSHREINIQELPPSIYLIKIGNSFQKLVKLD